MVKINQIKTSKETAPLSDAILLSALGAIAINPNLTTQVDKDYEEHKREYMRTYKNSSLYRHVFFTGYPVEISIRMQKVTSMYLYHEEQGMSGRDFIIQYIISGYKRIYDYVERNSTLSLVTIANLYNHEQYAYTADMSITLLSGVALYLGYDTHEVKTDQHFQIVLNNMISFCSDMITKDEDFIKEVEENQLPALRKFQEVLGFKLGKTITVDDIIGNHEEYLVKKVLTKQELQEYVRRNNFHILYRKGIYRFWKPLTAVLRFSNINEMNFQAVEVTRKEITDIYSIFTISKKQGRLTDEDYEQFFTASLLTLMMSKHYLNIQEIFQAQLERDSEVEELEKEEKVKVELATLKKEEKEYQRREVQMQERLKAQEEEIERLRKMVKQEENQAEEFERLKKEVVALREYTFSERNQLEEDTDEEIDSLTEEIAYLRDKRIAIIGGHPKLHRRLKKHLPNIRTVLPEEKSVDLSFLPNMDIVAIVATYTNHSQSERALSAMDSKNTELLYINEKNAKRAIRTLAGAR